MHIRTIVTGVSLVVVLAACGSAATAAPGASPTPAVGASATPAAVTPPPSTAAGTSQQPAVSFAGDPDLASKFPKQVGGKPVTNVTTSLLIDFFRALGTTQAQIDETKAALAPVGIDLNTVVFGTANATVNGSSVGIQAFKVPGQDASKLIQNYAAFSPLNSGDTLKQETSGGKNVSVVRDANGYASTWLYASGEILWSVNTSDDKEAAAVFTALP